MKKTKVVIEVEKGMVVGVYSNDPDIDVTLIDWDNINTGSDSKPDEDYLDGLSEIYYL